jgi:toxin secretion/phage lysis holin
MIENKYIYESSSVLGGICAFLLGGFDTLIVALLIVMLADWVTGVLKAFKKRKFSPTIGLWGIVNKLVVLIIIVAMNFVQQGLAIPLPLRETVVVMILINEGLSVLRNASTFVKGLEPITKYFEHIRINAIKVFIVEEKRVK